MSDLAMKILTWQSGGNVGVSSATMASISVGLEKPIYGSHFCHPYDPSDLRRCMELVDAVPEIRENFEEIGEIVPKFKCILSCWDELTELLRQEISRNTGRAPLTYARMEELLK